MILHILSIFDEAIGAYSPPFYARSVAEGIRNFSDIVQDKNSHISKHAADYTLFAIGVFHDHDGKIEQQAMHKKLITGLECRALSSDETTLNDEINRSLPPGIIPSQ